MVSADRVQITLSGGAPWGFRLSGGGGLPLIINKIRKKSQAHEQGLKEGDSVISINGVHVHDKTQDEALELVEAAGDSLSLEIFRGGTEELSRDKPKKTIQILSSGSTQAGTLRLLTTSDDGVSPGEVILIPSSDGVTSDSCNTIQSGGFKVRATVDSKLVTTIPVVNVSSSSGRTVRIPINDVTSSKAAVLDKSPVISFDAAHRDVQSAITLPKVTAKPFFVSQAGSTGPTHPPPVPPPYGQPTPPGSQKPQQVVSSAPQVFSSQLTPGLSSQPLRSQPAPPVSPKPQAIVISQPPSVRVQPLGVTSSVTSSTFDDGQTHREVKREQHIHSSDDGRSTTISQKQTTTTTTKGHPSFVKNQASAFNAVPAPETTTQIPHKQHQSSTSTRKSTTSIINQKDITPFATSTPSNNLQQPFQTYTITNSRNTENQLFSNQAPLFKPTKFVPSSGKKDVPGLYTPTSPLVDLNVHIEFKDGKENVSPQPMFQVKNIVSDKAKSSGPEMWRPNMWLPGQQPSHTEEQSHVPTPKEDISSSAPFPVPMTKPGYSLVEEQKRKLMALHTPKNEYDDGYSQDIQDSQGHHKHERLHVFAPPVEIHAEQESPYSPNEDHYYIDEYDDGPSSPDSSGMRRKKKLYADSAFYDTPGKSYPTITEQMKLCKTIAQSLTSAANRRARGAKMFMKRKRKSSKWIHEGHSELSSSAGDVANLQELDSELAPDEGGNKPLLYFKIPSLKHRVGDESKQTKMALSQEQFEKLRLNSKKCDHKSLPPDPCFDIVADLKAHKGRGGRLFERRKHRSDKFVIDETNAKFAMPHGKFDINSPQPGSHHLTPKEVALKHGWKGDPGSSQNVQAPAMPLVRSSLKSDESPSVLKGTNFNRTARGWNGGGEYPIAESLHHISPIRELGPSQASPSISHAEQSYNKVKDWQTAGELASVSSPFQTWNRNQQDVRKQDYRQARTQDDLRGRGWGEQRPADHQNPRPKSWQAERDDSQRYRAGHDYGAAPVDHRYGSGGHPTVAYKQPIIPGTDL